MESELVRIEGLTKRYGAFTAIDNIDLTLIRGKIVGLLGPNGSGKTTLIKMMCGLLSPTSGRILINGNEPGVETKAMISYLPDRMYFASWAKTKDMLDLFSDFYADFDRAKAESMCASLGITPQMRMKAMSKGTKEKLQLVLAMSRKAQLYILDEPIAGVDPAARDFILDTILRNYNENGTVLISTHLIEDVEKTLDEVIFLREGKVVLYDAVDNVRSREGKSVDTLFREIFRAQGIGGDNNVR